MRPPPPANPARRAARPLVAAWAALLAVDCGGGGGASDATAPVVDLAFPGPVALTDAATTTLVGSARSPFGVAALAIAGQPVVSFDGFANWSLDVAPALGDLALALDITDGRGRRRAAVPAGVLRRVSVVLHAPADVVTRGSSAFVLDSARHAIAELDLGSDDATIRSDPRVGTGPALAIPTGFDVDAARQLAFVAEARGAQLLAVDLATGVRSVASGPGRGAGPAFLQPAAVVDDAPHGLLYVADRQGNAVFVVKEANGDRALLSDASHGSGPTFRLLTDLALDAAKQRLLAVDPLARAVFTVALSDGRRALLSDDTHGRGPTLQSPLAVTLTADGARAFVLDGSNGRIVRVDLVSGDRVLVSDPATAGEPSLDGARNLAFADVGGEQLLIADERHPELVAARVLDGARTLVQPWNVGSGAPLLAPFALAFEPATRSLLVADVIDLLQVDLATGVRTEVTSATRGRGPAPLSLLGVASDRAHGRCLALDTEQGLLAIDLRSGDRTLLADLAGDPAITQIDFGFAFDATRGEALVVVEDDQRQVTVRAIDVATGATRLVSGAGQGVGPALGFVSSLALSADGAHLVAVDEAAVALIEIDRTSGDRRVIAAAGDGHAPALTSVLGATLAADGSFALLSGIVAGAEFDDPALLVVDLASGARQPLVLGSDPTIHGPFVTPIGLAFDASRGVVFASDIDCDALSAISFQIGDRAVVAR